MLRRPHVAPLPERAAPRQPIFDVQLEVDRSLHVPMVQIESHGYTCSLCWKERLLRSVHRPCPSTSTYHVHRADPRESMVVVQTQELLFFR